METYGAGVIQYPIVAEMDVADRKVTGSATASSNASMTLLKQNAIADAIRSSNADILVEPVFETVRQGTRMRATVTGFPAKYSRFRPIRAEDVPLIEAGILQRANTSESYEVEENVSGNSAKRVVGIITLAGLLGLGIVFGSN